MSEKYSRLTNDLAWRLVFLLAGVVITLLGAWATHSVTKEQLTDVLAQHDTVSATRIGNLQDNQKQLLEAVRSMQERLTQLGEDVAAMGAAVGVPRIHHQRKPPPSDPKVKHYSDDGG